LYEVIFKPVLAERGADKYSVIASCVGSFVAYVKGKVVPVHAIKAYREKRGSNPLLLNLQLHASIALHPFPIG
jgi:hypothetical protein